LLWIIPINKGLLMILLLKIMPAKKSAWFFPVFTLYMFSQVYAAYSYSTFHSTIQVVVSIKPLHSLVAGVMQRG